MLHLLPGDVLRLIARQYLTFSDAYVMRCVCRRLRVAIPRTHVRRLRLYQHALRCSRTLLDWLLVHRPLERLNITQAHTLIRAAVQCDTTEHASEALDRMRSMVRDRSAPGEWHSMYYEYDFSTAVALIAAREGRIEPFIWLRKRLLLRNGTGKCACIAAAEHGHAHVLAWLLANLCLPFLPFKRAQLLHDLCNAAARARRLEPIRWLHQVCSQQQDTFGLDSSSRARLCMQAETYIRTYSNSRHSSD